MKPESMESILHSENIQDQIKRYLALIENIAAPAGSPKGLALFAALKRQEVGAGPYPNVTLFEAANRIMTDLVLLYGVRWLLEAKCFPFTKYAVEYGHGNKSAFDVIAEANGGRLIGEAFNVAPSFFQTKKTAMLKKLRAKGRSATHTLILCNADAVKEEYVPDAGNAEYHLILDVGTGQGRMEPKRPAIYG